MQFRVRPLGYKDIFLKMFLDLKEATDIFVAHISHFAFSGSVFIKCLIFSILSSILSASSCVRISSCTSLF